MNSRVSQSTGRESNTTLKRSPYKKYDKKRSRHTWRIVVALVILAALVLVVTSAAPTWGKGPDGVAVPVKYSEGTVHGFLDLRNEAGELLAQGDLLQLVKKGVIESRMIFHFKNSVFEETVTFTQNGVFTMQDYHLVQSGPAFAEDIDARLSRSGAYTVKTKSHDDGEEKTYGGTIENLPPDVYNGMVITVAKNLPTGGNMHIVAFTPEPRVVDLELEPAAATKVLVGKHPEATQHYKVKPHLGPVLRFFAKVKGQAPPDSDLWIVTELVPAFVRFQGPLYAGPVWRVDLTAPGWR